MCGSRRASSRASSSSRGRPTARSSRSRCRPTANPARPSQSSCPRRRGWAPPVVRPSDCLASRCRPAPGGGRRGCVNASGDAKSALSTDHLPGDAFRAVALLWLAARRRRPPSTARSAATARQRRACARATQGLVVVRLVGARRGEALHREGRRRRRDAAARAQVGAGDAGEARDGRPARLRRQPGRPQPVPPGTAASAPKKTPRARPRRRPPAPAPAPARRAERPEEARRGGAAAAAAARTRRGDEESRRRHDRLKQRSSTPPGSCRRRRGVRGGVIRHSTVDSHDMPEEGGGPRSPRPT